MAPPAAAAVGLDLPRPCRRILVAPSAAPAVGLDLPRRRISYYMGSRPIQSAGKLQDLMRSPQVSGSGLAAQVFNNIWRRLGFHMQELDIGAPQLLQCSQAPLRSCLQHMCPGVALRIMASSGSDVFCTSWRPLSSSGAGAQSARVCRFIRIIEQFREGT